VIFSGCGRVSRLDSKEQKSEIMVRAYALEDKGEYKPALELYKEAMERYPQFARPNLDAALLYQERNHDYVLAIYHYRKYLDMRPSTQKKSMIKKHIRECEEALADDYIRRRGGAVTVSDLRKSCAVLRNTNQVLSNRLARVQGELRALKESEHRRYVESVSGISESGASVDSVKPPVDTTKAAAAGGRRPSGRRVKPVIRNKRTKPASGSSSAGRQTHGRKAPERPQTYTVRRGESLSLIARRVYGDGSLWPKIRKANRDILGDADDVKVGQVLKIP